MSKILRRLLSIFVICVSLSTIGVGFSETESSLGDQEHYYAQVFDGKVRINTLCFNNQDVKEPLLIYMGNYYLPMTSEIMVNLGVKSDMSSDGNMEFTLKRPEIDGNVRVLSDGETYPSKVEVMPYVKDMTVNNVLIHSENTFTPAIVYNHTIYLPLSQEMVNDGLEIDMGFSDQKVLTIIKDMEKMMGGTLDVLPSHDRKVYIESIELELTNLKDQVIALGSKYDLEGQTQYVLDNDSSEDSYIEFDDGSWMVLSQPLNGPGKVMHTYGGTEDRYVGEYLDGRYQGIGRYSDADGNFTAIKTFEDHHKEVVYTQEVVDYLDYTPTLAVLVEFNDERIFGSNETWYNKLFDEDANSLRGYYKEVTHDRVNLIPAIESNGIVNDGIVRVHLDIKHPNSGKLVNNSEELVKAITSQLEDQVNFGIFDKNDNGIIDANELVLIGILAGYEASNETPADYAQFRARIARSFDMSIATIDDIGLLNMILASERAYFSGATELTSSAVFAHELGHQFGLVDLYDNDGSSKGLGPFSLMAEGTGNYVRGQSPGETIAFFDPWSLIQLQALTPEVVTETGEYVLNSAETGNYNTIRINTSNENEYFLLENRRIVGRDLGLKNALKHKGGILIYHIDEGIINEKYVTNTINDDEGHKGIDIEESSERTMGSVLDSKEYLHRLSPFFSAQGVSEFNDSAAPKSRLNDGTQSGISVKVLTDGPSSNIMITIE
jgi:M6 family metalloprotease-like protein